MKARIKFRKYGVMKFIGHLDVMRFFQKAMRRAGIPIAFTGGYSPHMIMSFAQPLGVGVTSDGEYLDIELTEPIDSIRAVKQLNEVMVEGIDIVSFLEIPEDKKASGMTIVAAAKYRVSLLLSAKSSEEVKEIPADFLGKIDGFLMQPQILVRKKTKRSEREVDIRPMIYRMTVCDNQIEMFLSAGSEENLKPDLVMEAFFRYAGIPAESQPLHYHRIDVYAKNPDRKNEEEAFVTLESLGQIITPA